MVELAQFPYEGYKLYIVLHKKMGRRMANLVKIGGARNDRMTISYARYVMAVHLGRRLEPHETVDHDDEDKLNDHIDNLKIMGRVANKLKSQKPRQFNEFTCPVCGSPFKRRQGASWNVEAPTCSRPCGRKSAAAKLRNRKLHQN